MGSLLSTVTTCYLEPKFGIELANTGKMINTYEENTVIKFQSLSLMNPILLTGKKVFLYRSLAQHLCKIKTVEQLWIHHRILILKDNIKQSGLKHNFNLTTNIDLIAYQWVCSIIEMLSHDDVLWIRSNDFFKNKKLVMEQVCNHFQLSPITDFSLANINVKKLELLGKNDPLNIDLSDNLPSVEDDHGIIENDICLNDSEICNITKKIEESFPFLKEYLC
jgi:hypothetical protein